MLENFEQKKDNPEDKEKLTHSKEEPIAVHSMPEQFHDGSGKKREGKKNKFLFIAIIVIIVLVLGVAAAFLFQRLIGPKENVNGQNLNTTVVNSNANLNQNLNQNENLNKNANENLNQNLNQNTNVNLNVNTNLNQNTNENTNLNVNQNVNLNVNAPLPSSLDSDRDGLTDTEEEVFGTEKNKPDSDSDSYSDGQEIGAGYDPLGSGRLVSSTAIKIYTNQDYQYSLLYPQAWLAQATGSDNKEVLFTADTAEFVEVLVSDNPSSLTATEWYLSQFPGLTEEDLTLIETWENQEGVLSLDGNTIYFAVNDYVYLITYNTGTRTEANFRATFEMMFQSFEIVSEEQGNANANTNLNNNSNQNTNANQNSNINQNQNSNLNSNSNSNANINENQNGNTNSY